MPGSMPPKPSTSTRGHSWAAPPWAARLGIRLFLRGPRAPGAVAVDPRAGPWRFRLSFGLGREKSRFRGRKARSGKDLVMAKGPFGEVPRPSEPTPLDSAPSRPHRPLGSLAYLLGAWEAICIECAFDTHLRAHAW